MNSPKRSKRFRFQFSLRTFLVVVLLLGATLGIWVGMVQPIRNQWAAVEPILELGGRVETSPSDIPNWLKRLLPAGQTENIEAVFFNYHKATDEAVVALEKLPHLKRLYVEKAQLNSKHLKTIAKLKNLERLSLWDTGNLSNDDLTPLAKLENLEVLDMHGYGKANWKVLLPFRENQKIKIVQRLIYDGITIDDLSQLEDLKSVERFCEPLNSVCFNRCQISDLKKLLQYFPTIHSVWISFEGEIEPTYFSQLLQVSHDEPLEITLYNHQANNQPATSSQIRHLIRAAWDQLGPHCDLLGVETGNDRNQLILGFTKDMARLEVSIFINSDISPRFFKQLPMLPDVLIFKLIGYGGYLAPGMEHVLEKIPNVTEVDTFQASKYLTKFWGWLPNLEKVEKLTMRYDHTYTPSKALPRDFPEKFLLRKTLTELDISINRFETEVAKRFLDACPKLESFQFSGRKVSRDGKGGIRAR